MRAINIIGAGLSGLSAAISLAESGRSCRIISAQRSERAQSVLAEGGINAALDTMGEHDSVQEHFEDTMRGGAYLADPNAVEGLTRNAPETVTKLLMAGAPFNLTENGVMLRNFGGQKKKRTAYAKSSTGKILMTALIDAARKYEDSGLIERYPHHEFIRLLLEGRKCTGVRVRDSYTGLCADFSGAVILASGGMNGMFPERTTGTTQNTGDVAATVFSQGVSLANLEMMQYHPTTVSIQGKKCLVTEAARGEGGRLFVNLKNGGRRFFMEEKYPELGNLMPRDVVAREMFFVRREPDTEGGVFLDMTGLSPDVWKNKLPDLREELIHYLGIDPKAAPIPVHEGIHYFMGGIYADELHRANLEHLYAAGECCCQYHGANRLGGNSMLGAIYGGRIAAQTAIAETTDDGEYASPSAPAPEFEELSGEPLLYEASGEFTEELAKILESGLGIVRNEDSLNKALGMAEKLETRNERELCRKRLGIAMLRSALERRESRGAHYREDFPAADEAYRKTTVAELSGGDVQISFKEIPERRGRR